MMIKVVFDTNVIIDGLTGSREDCENIINHLDSEKYRMRFSQETIGELLYISKGIAHREFKDEDNRVAFVQNISGLFFYAKSVNTLKVRDKLEVYCDDKFDDMFLECAYAGEVDYLVTNDIKSGLLNIDSYDFKIITSRQFLSLLE